jgi:hypothetical protein
MDSINKEILKLSKLMVEKFGEPQEGLPTLKNLLDMYIFYNECKGNYSIKNFDDEININMSFYIDERINHIMNSGYALYNIQNK